MTYEPEKFFGERSEMSTRILRFDWSQTELGPIAQWDPGLRFAVKIVLESPLPQFVTWGPARTFVYNDALIALLGSDKHPGALGSTHAKVWSEVWSTLEPILQQVTLGNPRHFADYPFQINRNGKLEDGNLTFTYSALTDESGEVRGIFCTTIETTARVEALLGQKIQEAERQLTSFFLQAPSPMVILLGEDHRFQLVNEPYEQLAGRTDLIGRSVAEVFDKGEADIFLPMLDGVYRTGISHMSHEVPTRLSDAAGVFHDVCLNVGYHAFRDNFGKIIGVLGFIQDVTTHVEARRSIEEGARALERAKDQLEAEQIKFKTIVDDATTSIAILAGPDFVFEVANQSYLSLFNNRDIVGKPFLEALPELKGQPFPKLAAHVFETGETYREREARALLQRTADSPLEERFFDQIYSRIVDKTGKPYGIFIHAVEVTERVKAHRELEESSERLRVAILAAESASSAKSSFLANMSHEIRTPLGAIMGFVSLLKDIDLGDKMRANHISIIERNSVQLLRIIDDILDLSKVEAGLLLIEHIEFSLVEMLSDFASLMGFRSREKGILFELKAVSELPSVIVSDPTRIRQILMNVVGNAIKFTDRGSVILRVGYTQGELRFEVEDTGRGIGADQITNLFQPFSQADVSTTRKYGGTGLGLVLTLKLCEAMGGTFALKNSRLDYGSVFDAIVKVSLAENAKMVRALGFETTPLRDAGVQGLLQGRRILVVEDSPDNQMLFSLYLSRANARVDIAPDGARGVEMALAEKYDVVLMDVQMPVMDGITAVRVLRAKNYSRPIIALTAHAMKEERLRCLDAGYTDFLSKPTLRAELIEMILKYVNQDHP